ncbi:MAG: HAMP domain-containing histidine kinase [Aestuariivirgaceae bacterium]|nr:HAMP domain-containing histidine kinase [Aestuariivirgaceae bacterium]
MRANLKLLQTSTFRLAAAYLAVFAVSVGLVLGYVYWNTALLLERQLEETIQAEVQGLGEQYRTRGVAGLMETVERRSAMDSNSVYLVTNFHGTRLAGNLQGLPPSATKGKRGWVEFTYAVATARGPEQHQARAFHVMLPDGATLVVGRDVEERRNLAQIIRRTLYWALGLTLVLGTGGGLLMSRNFLARVDAMTGTARSIMQGELSRRVALSGSGDELDRLAISLNAMLDQIERLMGGMREVSSNVAHDLRTPLTRLRARLEGAIRSGSAEEQREALTETLEDADRLLQTFNALLSIARTEAGQAREGLTSMEVAPVIEEMAELYGPSAEEQGGTLTVRAAEGARLRGDRQLLAQALANLIDNALKYGEGADGKPDITVASAVENGEVILSVSDRGPGIAEEDRARVLERFVRLDASRTKPGSGLGLSLVAGIVKLHQGRLALEDNSPGLTVKLILPRETQAG